MFNKDKNKTVKKGSGDPKKVATAAKKAGITASSNKDSNSAKPAMKKKESIQSYDPKAAKRRADRNLYLKSLGQRTAIGSSTNQSEDNKSKGVVKRGLSSTLKETSDNNRKYVKKEGSGSKLHPKDNDKNPPKDHGGSYRNPPKEWRPKDNGGGAGLKPKPKKPMPSSPMRAVATGPTAASYRRATSEK
jgi:hypothetical protein